MDHLLRTCERPLQSVLAEESIANWFNLGMKLILKPNHSWRSYYLIIVLIGVELLRNPVRQTLALLSIVVSDDARRALIEMVQEYAFPIELLVAINARVRPISITYGWKLTSIWDVAFHGRFGSRSLRTRPSSTCSYRVFHPCASWCELWDCLSEGTWGRRRSRWSSKSGSGEHSSSENGVANSLCMICCIPGTGKQISSLPCTHYEVQKILGPRRILPAQGQRRCRVWLVAVK